MRTVKVKICGITNETDLADATDAGANAVGFIVGVESSPRNLSAERARSLLAKVPPFVSSVVVTKESNPQNLKRLSITLRSDFIQVYCEIREIEGILKELGEYVATILGVDGQKCSAEDLLNMSGYCEAVLVDTLSDMKCGGTGRTHDWNASKRLRQAVSPKPVILAGGLNPENVAEAVRVVEPYAVDVASGVEHSPGKKDRAKIVQFIKNAKSVQL
jgi:phosphoribosylanthranilate isomerase